MPMRTNSTAFDEAWLEEAVASSATRIETGLSGTVALNSGSTTLVTATIESGRITGAASGTPDVVFPFGESQASDYLAGDFDAVVAYMKGDLKPEGSTGALLAGLDMLSFLSGRSD